MAERRRRGGAQPLVEKDVGKQSDQLQQTERDERAECADNKRERRYFQQARRI